MHATGCYAIILVVEVTPVREIEVIGQIMDPVDGGKNMYMLEFGSSRMTLVDDMNEGCCVKVIGVRGPHNTLSVNNSVAEMSEAHPIEPPFAVIFT
jgi:hypothetical protein